jgi:CRISPR/Cas system-associated exonuclease Cas4 (RecB family)
MYQKVLKHKEPQSIHLTRGNDIHKTAEDYVNKVMTKLPPVLAHFGHEFNNLVRLGAKAEEELVLDRHWKQLDDWNHPDTWLRLKLDARIDNYLIDYKTGKPYDTHVDQARLYANAWMMLHPDVQEVDVEFWYLDSGNVKGWTFYRTDLDEHVQNWELQVKAMMEDELYEPRINQYCKYCYVKDLCNAYK